MSELVDGLRQAITESSLTHYAIGKASGVDTAIIDRFMSGERDIRLETAGKIAESLGYKLTKSESEMPAQVAPKATAKRKRSK